MHFDVFGFSVEPWVFAVFTAGWFFWEVGRLWLALASEIWPFVIGDVREARIEDRTDADGDGYFVPYVRYTYRVRGEDYEGKRLAFHPRGASTSSAAKKMLRGVSAN